MSLSIRFSIAAALVLLLSFVCLGGLLVNQLPTGSLPSILTWAVGMALVLLLGISVGVMYALCDRLVGARLRAAAGLMQQVVADPTKKPGIVDPQTDEVGTMLRTFAQLADSLRDSQRELEQRVSERTNALESQIKERQQAEEALRWQALTFETISDAVIFTNSEGQIIEWNPAAERMFGHTRAEALGQSTAMLHRSRDATALTTHAIHGMLRDGRWAGEIQFVRKDGSQGVCETVIMPACNETGHRLATIAVHHDITERKRAEESHERLAAIVECSHDAIITMTVDGRIVTWNPAAERLYGYEQEAVHGQPISLLIPGDRTDCMMAVVQKIKRGERVRHYETVHLHAGGARLSVSLSLSPITDSEGKVSGISIIARDMSERIQAERELHAAKEAAEAASRAKSEFLANMSHEIRTPLNGILGMTALALDTELRPEQARYLEMARGSAEALLEIVNDILDFSKIEAGKLDLEAVDFCLRDELDEALKMLALRAHKKGLELACRVEPEVPDTLNGDPGRLRQVLVNLVGNAIKFTEKGEVLVNVGTESNGDKSIRLHFAVTDTGIGIPLGKQAAIFAPFTQADGSTTRKYGGTGLGLTISSRLVRMMSGRIWVDSNIGQGSTFHFTACFAPGRPTAALAAPLESVDLKGLSALAVDDHPTNRCILQEMLVDWGMRPTLAEDGRGATAALDSAAAAGQCFQLVLVDFMMPDTNGLQLAERIRAHGAAAGAPIILLSSGERPDDIQRCGVLGLAAHLTKPVKPSELLRTILKVLRRARTDVKDVAETLISADTPFRLTSADAWSGRRILLAEDNPVNREVAVQILRKHGHDVVVVGDGRAALEALAAREQDLEQRIDLVVMDLQMPEMDGFDALHLIRKEQLGYGRHVPVVALTAHALKGDRERCLEAGFDAYLAKPVRPTELLAVAETLSTPLLHQTPVLNRVTSPGFKPDLALERAGGSVELLHKLASLFLADCSRMQDRARSALAVRDYAKLSQVAHTLKGSTGYFGANDTVQAAAAMEELAMSSDPSAIEAGWCLLDDRLNALKDALHDLVAAPAA